jgi:hypothetical protein
MCAWLERVVFARAWATFIVMVAAFAFFGGGTVNLFMLLAANLQLVALEGVMALVDGEAWQFVELVATLMLSMAAYVLFKSCEQRLVQWLLQGRNSGR